VKFAHVAAPRCLASTRRSALRQPENDLGGRIWSRRGAPRRRFSCAVWSVSRRKDVREPRAAEIGKHPGRNVSGGWLRHVSRGFAAVTNSRPRSLVRGGGKLAFVRPRPGGRRQNVGMAWEARRAGAAPRPEADGRVMSPAGFEPTAPGLGIQRTSPP
jgi:hypothetical protein